MDKALVVSPITVLQEAEDLNIVAVLVVRQMYNGTVDVACSHNANVAIDLASKVKAGLGPDVGMDAVKFTIPSRNG